MLGRVGLVVAMFVFFFVSLSDVPFSCNLLRGRTGAERASSVDWFRSQSRSQSQSQSRVDP